MGQNWILPNFNGLKSTFGNFHRAGQSLLFAGRGVHPCCPVSSVAFLIMVGLKYTYIGRKSFHCDLANRSDTGIRNLAIFSEGVSITQSIRD